MAFGSLCFGLLLFSEPFLLSQNRKSFLLIGIIIWRLDRIGVRNSGRLQVVFSSIGSIVLSTHCSCVPIWWVEGKMHSPLPIRNALVLVPPYCPVAANLLNSNISI